MSHRTIEDAYPMTCARCGRDVARVAIELDAECRIVCRDCYLADPPADDVDGTLDGLERIS
jgi:hypothetical protein